MGPMHAPKANELTLEDLSRAIHLLIKCNKLADKLSSLKVPPKLCGVDEQKLFEEIVCVSCLQIICLTTT